MMIRTNPPGALVYVDDYEIGTTPISTGFVYSGTRKIRLVKDGYETLTVMQPVPPPWYQIPPLDFITENLTILSDQRFLPTGNYEKSWDPLNEIFLEMMNTYEAHDRDSV